MSGSIFTFERLELAMLEPARLPSSFARLSGAIVGIRNSFGGAQVSRRLVMRAVLVRRSGPCGRVLIPSLCLRLGSGRRDKRSSDVGWTRE
mmetsp:Transcript_26892/g.78634  ORF Transcript_26892/g.78634 Transcript_26892/m.78634 type:complete len:91 (+) Transcript_26892:4501-4773(+)